MIINFEETEFFHFVEKVRVLNEGKNPRVHVITFGCQQNEADSEKILGIAEKMGYIRAEKQEGTDLIILNTCAIRQHAEEKALSMLGRFKAMKRKNPNLIVGVCGCMAAEKQVKDMLKNDFHYVTFTLEPNMLYKLPLAIYRFLTESKRSFVFGEDTGDIAEGLPMDRRNVHKAWVSIMYGCNNFCSYCIVPYVRGRERSRDANEIVSECQSLVDNGIKEITLLGQNVNSYKGECDFAGLLERIARIRGDFIIRFMTSHPKDVSPRLIEVMKSYSPKIAPYFHLPLQSGSDKILKKMNRTYNREKFFSIVSSLREAIPNICISTDVIVGFPGESEDDFLDTLDMLATVEFDMVYSFKYSPREGTPAAKMADAIDISVKEERMARLLEMQDEISKSKNDPYVGKTVRVLVDSVSRLGTLSARSDTNKLVHFEGEKSQIGEFVNVKITKAGAFELIAEQIKNN